MSLLLKMLRMVLMSLGYKIQTPNHCLKAVVVEPLPTYVSEFLS